MRSLENKKWARDQPSDTVRVTVSGVRDERMGPSRPLFGVRPRASVARKKGGARELDGLVLIFGLPLGDFFRDRRPFLPREAPPREWPPRLQRASIASTWRGAARGWVKVWILPRSVKTLDG